MTTYCKHCINPCKTLDVKNNCTKYKIETVEQLKEQKKKMNKQAIGKLNYLDYGI